MSFVFKEAVPTVDEMVGAGIPVPLAQANFAFLEQMHGDKQPISRAYIIMMMNYQLRALRDMEKMTETEKGL